MSGQLLVGKGRVQGAQRREVHGAGESSKEEGAGEGTSLPLHSPPLPPRGTGEGPSWGGRTNQPTSRGTVWAAWSGAKRSATRESLSLCQAEEEGGWAPWGHRASGSVTPRTGSSPRGSLTLKVCSAAGHNQCFQR